MKENDFRKNLTAKEIIEIFHTELAKLQRPANELILTDAELCRMLNISKRTSSSWRSEGKLSYEKVGGTVFYIYSDVLQMLNQNRIEAPIMKRKF